MIPAIILILFIYAGPLLFTMVLSFTDWTGLGWDINFIGLDNFKRIFSSRNVLLPISNTLKFALFTVIFQNLVALVVALILNEDFKGRNFFRAIFFLPSIISTVAVGYIWTLIFDPVQGPVSLIVNTFGLEFLNHIRWLGDPKVVVYSLILVNIWQWFGWNMVIFIAGLQGIPADIYEAASIDGASPIQRFWNITFPLLAPTITINIILTTIGGLKVFDLPYVMTGGGPGNYSQSITMKIIEDSFFLNKVGYGASLTILMFAIILIVSIAQNRLLTRREVD